jgi:hypothetical protein
LLVIAISSVIPLSWLWLWQCLLAETPFVSIPSASIRHVLTSYAIVECLFSIYQISLYVRMQRRSTAPSLTNAERDEHIAYALANITDLRRTLSKWFLNCSHENIDRSSIVGWLAFAFYSKYVQQLHDDEREQIETLIDKIEITHQWRTNAMPSNETRAYMKHTLDPVRAIFRPFAFYVVTDTLLNGVIGSSLFYLRQYRFVRMGQLDMWTYANPLANDEPIVFFHGIGSGLLFYQPFVAHLHRRFARTRRLIFISMPCICLRYPSMNNISTMSNTLASLELIFDTYQMTKAIFIGHR